MVSFKRLFKVKGMNNMGSVIRDERGNVLFLILIAVALFAALSYAVTQSTRSGGGSADKEKSILSGASMSQYPASLRTSLVRMVLAGTDVTNVKFNAPADFSAVSETGDLVFHPNGGAAVFQRAPADVMAGSSQGAWFFNANFAIPQIGIDDAGSGNDIIAFLPGVSTSVCENVNKELSINTTGCTLNGTIPILATAADETDIQVLMNESYTFPSTGEVLQGQGCTVFSGQPSGCFFDANVTVSGTTGVNVFYSVLLER